MLYLSAQFLNSAHHTSHVDAIFIHDLYGISVYSAHSSLAENSSARDLYRFLFSLK